MAITLEISTTNYSDDAFAIKKALSHMETLTGAYNGYVFGEPRENIGWTFFQIAFKSDLHDGIATRFSDMISRYRSGKPDEKFAEFMRDYFASKDCEVRVKAVS